MKKTVKKVVAKAPVKKIVAKKPLRKAQDGISFKNRTEALGMLNQNPREDILKSIESSKKRKDQEKEFYNSLPPVEAGRVRAPYSSAGVDKDIQRNTNQLKYRDSAEKYLRENDKANPIGRLKTKVVTPIQKKGGATKAAYKKGGVVKKVTAKKVMIKSKKK
jgi:hypothetical protein